MESCIKNLKIKRESFMNGLAYYLNKETGKDVMCNKHDLIIASRDSSRLGNWHYDKKTTYDIIFDDERVVSVSSISEKIIDTDEFRQHKRKNLDMYLSYSAAKLILLNAMLRCGICYEDNLDNIVEECSKVREKTI